MMEYKNKRNPILPLRYHVPDGEAHMMPVLLQSMYGCRLSWMENIL